MSAQCSQLAPNCSGVARFAGRPDAINIFSFGIPGRCNDGMSWKRVIACTMLALCFVRVALAADKSDGWAKLKSGMTPTEAKSTLGEPLIRTHGRGFELWMYDSGAEVVCFLGVVVAWTGPEGKRTTEGRGIDLRVIKPVAVPPTRVATPVVRAGAYRYDGLGLRPFRLPKL